MAAVRHWADSLCGPAQMACCERDPGSMPAGQAHRPLLGRSPSGADRPPRASSMLPRRPPFFSQVRAAHYQEYGGGTAAPCPTLRFNDGYLAMSMAFCHFSDRPDDERPRCTTCQASPSHRSRCRLGRLTTIASWVLLASTMTASSV